jgi:LuxR family maltose regulon positive regulatory protein
VHAAAALGMALLARGDHAEAHETLSGARATAERLGLPCAQAVCASGLAYLYAVSGLLREAERMAHVALAEPPCPARSTHPHCGYAYAALALVGIERNRPDDAEANLRLLAEFDDDPSLAEVVSVLRAHRGPARGVMPSSPADGAGHRAVQLEVGFHEAVAAHRRGDRRGAADGLEQVLAAAEPDGFRRVFVLGGPAGRELLLAHLDSGTAYWQTVNELIAAIDSAGPLEPATAELPEALTQREVTVLRYLQSVLSNAEIASDMCVSVNTVKTHVRNIYRKLDTTRRRDAVRRARQLHLL